MASTAAASVRLHTSTVDVWLTGFNLAKIVYCEEAHLVSKPSRMTQNNEISADPLAASKILMEY